MKPNRRQFLQRAAAAGIALPFGPALAQAPKQLEKISLMTSFRIFGGDAPFFVGREKGYFSERGIDLEILEGTGSSNTAKVVAARSAHVGEVDGGVVIRSIAEGLPIKVVAGYTQSSPLCIIVPKKLGVTTPKGLEGKRIGGAAGAAGELLLPAWLKKNGADPDKVQVVTLQAAARNATLIQGQVDGIVGFSNGDLLIDRHPTANNVLLVGAGSGHGFKHGPEVGRYAAELLTGKLKQKEPRFSLETKGDTQNRAVH